MTNKCQCEHVAHLQPDVHTPFGSPGHKHSQEFPTTEMIEIITAYGNFLVCFECAQDCFEGQTTPKIRRRRPGPVAPDPFVNFRFAEQIT